jgi:hypothetical protein
MSAGTHMRGSQSRVRYRPIGLARFDLRHEAIESFPHIGKVAGKIDVCP